MVKLQPGLAMRGHLSRGEEGQRGEVEIEGLLELRDGHELEAHGLVGLTLFAFLVPMKNHGRITG